jgi:hypothetical protein
MNACCSISVMICASHSDEVVLLSTNYHWTVYVCFQPDSYIHFYMKLVGVCFSWVGLCVVHYPSLLFAGGKLGTTIVCEVPLYVICTVHDSSTGVVAAIIFK